jgi:hypothetical protein
MTTLHDIYTVIYIYITFILLFIPSLYFFYSFGQAGWSRPFLSVTDTEPLKACNPHILFKNDVSIASQIEYNLLFQSRVVFICFTLGIITVIRTLTDQDFARASQRRLQRFKSASASVVDMLRKVRKHVF